MAEYVGVFYVLAVLIPPFLTNDKRLYILGGIHVVAFIFTWFFMARYLISVWCFLAAVSSMVILLLVWRGRKK